MSFFSYQQGLNQGNADALVAIRERNAAVQDGNEAVAEWKRHCDQLMAKLADLQKQVACTAAREARRDAQQRALRDALAKLAPGNPLLSALPAIGDKAMLECFTRHGYEYDLATETLRKI